MINGISNSSTRVAALPISGCLLQTAHLVKCISPLGNTTTNLIAYKTKEGTDQ